MNPPNKNKKAFTLMEVLIAIAIFSIVVGGVITLLISTSDFYEATSLNMDLSNRGRLVLRGMVQDLKKSTYQAVSVPTNTTTQYIIRYKSLLQWNSSNTPPIDYSNISFFTLNKTTKILTWGTSTVGSQKVISQSVADMMLVKDNTTVLDTGFSTSQRILLTITLSRQYGRGKQLDLRTQAFRETLYLMSEPK